MNKKYLFAFVFLFAVGVVLLSMFLLKSSTVAVFDPKGIIALQERTLIITATLLMLLVVIPVFILTFGIAWKYRTGNIHARYTPDHDHNLTAEVVWWFIPCVIILILAVITWKSTHELDPYRSLNATTKPITIEVVALDWKWLFIYPEQHIATVNLVEFPERTPVVFKITADAPMNSFWIPELGGQMYAMPGMVTQLHLLADGVGDYIGVSANFSGSGFSGMRFVAKSISQNDFDQWIASVKQLPNTLDINEYTALSKPSQNNPVTFYSSVEKGLYNSIVMKFMAPSALSTTTSISMPSMQGMNI